MKTKSLHITGSSTLMVLFMGLSLTVFGQTRTNYSRGGNTSTITRTASSTRRSNERTVVTQRQNTNNARTSFRNAESRTSSSGKKSNWNNNNSNHNNWNNNSGSKKNSNNWNSNKHSSYGYNDHNYHYNSHKDHWNKGYKHNKHGYYSYNHHPRSYNVWKFPAPWQHSKHAVVFRHNHNDFFFYNNVFYRYSAFRGYYAVSYPAGIVFTYLPVGYNEVMVNGRIYYRYGNVFFEPTFEGYRVVNPPSGIFVSFNF